MRSYDIIIVGAGLIGVTLALELRRNGARVLVLDRVAPGSEASWAGAGMLAAADVQGPPALRELAHASAGMYPGFVADIQSDAQTHIDLRRDGALHLFTPESLPPDTTTLMPPELAELEPGLNTAEGPAVFVPEDFVDPRTLIAAAIECAVARGVQIFGHSPVSDIIVESGRVTGVKSKNGDFAAGTVVDCAGAWSAQLTPGKAPTRPVKGHLVAVMPPRDGVLRHVLRRQADGLYLIPRTHGPIVIGSTIEEAGFDRTILPSKVDNLCRLGGLLLPAIAGAPVQDIWTGFRPGTPDELPILGASATHGLFHATGHYRNGILLAPITATVIAQLLRGDTPAFDIAPFSPLRFA